MYLNKHANNFKKKLKKRLLKNFNYYENFKKFS